MMLRNDLLGNFTLRHFRASHTVLSTTLNRLSTGLRINRAADDAAGLRIATRLKSMSQGMWQVHHNLQDGYNMARTAESSLADIQVPPLVRLRTLALQALNDTLTDFDRSALQNEVEAVKEEIASIINTARYNTLRLFTPHTQELLTVRSQAVLPPQVVIAEGVNDLFTVILNGQEHSIRLDPGSYDQAEFVARLNEQLNVLGVYASTTAQHLQITAHHAQELTVSGLELEIEAVEETFQVVIGNLYSENNLVGNLRVYQGFNDRLTFLVDGDPYTILLPTEDRGGGKGKSIYTPEQLLTTLNEQLDATGTGISVSLQQNPEDGSLSLVFHTRGKMVDGFGSSMLWIESGEDPSLWSVDPEDEFLYPTSILFDNVIYGYQRAASVIGNSNLSGGREIVTDENDSLTFQVDGETVTITLAPGNYSADALIEEINRQLTAENIQVTASLTTSSRLELTHVFAGEGRSIGNFSGSAYNTLMRTEHTQGPSSSAGTDPRPLSVRGTLTIAANTTITAGENDTLTFVLNGTLQTITLSPGTHGSVDLIAQINQQLSNASIPLEATTQIGRLLLTHEDPGTGNTLNYFGGNALRTLMVAPGNDPHTEPGYPIYEEGSTTPIDYTATYVEGTASLLRGLRVVAGENDTLTFRVDGAEQSITLTPGTYTRAGILTEINTRLSAAGAGVTASYGSSSRLRLTHADPHEDQSIDQLGGNAFPALFTDQAVTVMSFGSDGTSATLTGRADLTAGMTIHSANNTLTFDVDGTTKTIILDDGEYDRGDLLDHINDKLDDAGAGVTASMVYTSSLGELVYWLRLTHNETGGGIRITNPGGNAEESLLHRTYWLPTSSPSGSGTTRVGETAGRVDLRDEVVIATGANDTLTFDLLLERNGLTERQTVSITLEAGTYQGQDLLDALNDQLSGSGITAGWYDGPRPTFKQDMQLLSLGYQPGPEDDIDRFQIEAIRGSAAYTLFYESDTGYLTEITGTVELPTTLSIETEERLQLEIGGETVSLVLPPGQYSPESFISVLNQKFGELSQDLTAVLHEGKLQIRYLSGLPGQSIVLSGRMAQQWFYGYEPTNYFPADRHARQEVRTIETYHLQIGALTGQDLDTRIPPSLSLDILKLAPVSLLSRRQAELSLHYIDQAIAYVSSLRGEIGSVMSAIDGRMDYAVSSAAFQGDAGSRITDADIALEATMRIRAEILHNVNAALSAQINLIPQSILQLIEQSLR